MTTHLIAFVDGIATDKDGRQYRVVPVEPTEAIRKRMTHAYLQSHGGYGDTFIYAMWHGALSAATVDLESMAVASCTLSLDEMRDVYAVIQSCIHDAETSDEAEKLERLLARAEEEIFRADRWRIDALEVK